MRTSVAIVNSFDFGSTGVLCQYLRNASAPDINPVFLCSCEPHSGAADYYLYEHTSKLSRVISSYRAKAFNAYGFLQKKATKRALDFFDKTVHQGDQVVLHLHQLESSMFDLEELLNYAERRNARVFITLHDCWIFTGKCAYYDINGCRLWQDGCRRCPNHRDFPSTFASSLGNTHARKIQLLLKHQNRIVFICPSRWIYGELGKSLLKDMRRIVLNNGIALPQPPIETGKGRDANSRIGLIAAASPWTERKGLKYLSGLAKQLDYSRYSLTIVGDVAGELFPAETNLTGLLPREQLLIEFSKNDYFLNPTLEDNFPTTNIEALSLGLKVIAFRSGGACEAFDENTGYVCESKSVDALARLINSLNANQGRDACSAMARKYYSEDSFVKKHYHLYRYGMEK